MQIETYKDKAGEFRWRMRASNGQIIATSGEGYANRSDMIATINGLRRGFQHAKMVEVDGDGT